MVIGPVDDGVAPDDQERQVDETSRGLEGARAQSHAASRVERSAMREEPRCRAPRLWAGPHPLQRPGRDAPPCPGNAVVSGGPARAGPPRSSSSASSRSPSGARCCSFSSCRRRASSRSCSCLRCASARWSCLSCWSRLASSSSLCRRLSSSSRRLWEAMLAQEGGPQRTHAVQIRFRCGLSHLAQGLFCLLLSLILRESAPHSLILRHQALAGQRCKVAAPRKGLGGPTDVQSS